MKFLLIWHFFIEMIFQIPDQDIIYVLGGISLEGSGIAVRWLKVCASMLTSLK